MPKGSALDSLLFNFIIKNIFYFVQEAYICNFVDDNLLLSIEDSFKEVQTVLKENSELLQVWFYKNHMVLNLGKCHNLIMNKDIAIESTKLGRNALHAEVEWKLLGLMVSKDLNFQSHTMSIIKTINQKLSALIRVILQQKCYV